VTWPTNPRPSGQEDGLPAAGAAGAEGSAGAAGGGEERRGFARRAVPLALAALAAVAVLLAGGRALTGPLERFAAWVEGLGVWGPVVFVLGYAVAAVALAPGVVLTVAAGVLFGVFQGTVYSMAGATLGATLAFLLARYGARPAVERRFAANPRFRAIDRAIGRQGFRIVALLRLSPVIPFNLLNYALGLTRVRLLDYVAASVAMLPGTLLYVVSGRLGGSLAGAFAGPRPGAAGVAAHQPAARWAFLAAGLIATVAVTVYLTRLAGRALHQELGEDGGDGDERS
jgi:uncharacterized membrane protein YdjX (TVP38/TMEM64 family)